MSNNLKKIAQWLIGLSLFIAFLSACAQKEDVATTTLKPKQTLLMIGSDVSNTFSEFAKLPPQYLYDLCQNISQSGNGGVVAVCAIGRPDAAAYLRCPILPIKAIDRNALLRTQAEQAEDAKRIAEVNQKQIRGFIRRYNQLIYSRNNEADTDIQGFLQKTVDLANEPQFDGFAKHVFLYTDGIHDVKGHKKFLFPADNDLNGIHFYGCGIENQLLIKHLNIKKYESPEGFVASFSHP